MTDGIAGIAKGRRSSPARVVEPALGCGMKVMKFFFRC